MEKYKIKNRENNKTRAVCYIAGLFSHINLVNPRLAIEVVHELQRTAPKFVEGVSPKFSPGISAGTMGLSPRI